MNDVNQNDASEISNHLKGLFSQTEAVLDKWTGEGCLQFKVLFKMMRLEHNWTDEQEKVYDPMIRFFINHHSRYSSRRGAYGGVIRNIDKERLDSAKKEREANKIRASAAREEILKLVDERTNSLTMKITKEDLE